MFTEENIKEAISLRYIELVAAYNGYKTSSVYPDNGTDLSIIEVDYRIENEKKRYCDTGRELKIQVKATTQDSVSEDESKIKYDLEAKTFNDLIERRDNRYFLFLILFILPPNKTDWIKISDNELVTKKCAYWYFTDKNEIKTSNTEKKRITLYKKNLISQKTLTQLFEKFS